MRALAITLQIRHAQIRQDFMPKTRTRIHLIGVVAIAGAGLAAAAQYRGLETIRGQQTELQQAQAMTEAALRMDNAIMQARRAESELIYRHDVIQIIRLDGHMRVATSQIERLDELIGEASGLKDLRQTLGPVREQMKSYQQTFDTLADTEKKLGVGNDDGADAALTRSG
jgi:methyl-accepting chemotaxis protein